MAPPGPTGPSHRDGPMAFVESLDAPELSSDDRHHFGRVLRVADGEPMVVGDGEGGWRRARFGPDIEVDGAIERVPRPEPALSVGFALLKGDRPELVVQKLTELGIDRIVPFTSDHCVVRWNAERAHRQIERLRRVAREASMQCRRTHLPEVVAPATFAELVDGGAVLAEGDGIAIGAIPWGPDAPIVLVGPEGGWSDAELGGGVPHVRLGPHTLRAETAAIAAGTLLGARRDSGA